MALLNNITNFFPTSFLSNSSIPQSLGEEFSLCENQTMVFHWADFHETCDVIKSRMELDEDLRRDFESKERGLKKLADIPVWVKTTSKVYQTNMFELYEKFIIDQSQFIGGLDPFGPQQISLMSSTGPFKAMAIAECFNQATYRDFILVNLLRGKLPRRDFRLRLKSRVLLEFGEGLNSATLINLEQITTKGLLMSVDSEKYLKTPALQGRVRLLLDTKCLADSLDKAPAELSDHLSQFAFNLMYSSRKEDGIEFQMGEVKIQSSFDFLKNKKAYLFLPLSVLKENHPESEKAITDFITYSRKLARDHYGLDKEKIG